VNGSSILRILKTQGLAPEIPEDLYHLIKKVHPACCGRLLLPLTNFRGWRPALHAQLGYPNPELRTLA